MDKKKKKKLLAEQKKKQDQTQTNPHSLVKENKGFFSYQNDRVSEVDSFDFLTREDEEFPSYKGNAARMTDKRRKFYFSPYNVQLIFGEYTGEIVPLVQDEVKMTLTYENIIWSDGNEWSDGYTVVWGLRSSLLGSLRYILSIPPDATVTAHIRSIVRAFVDELLLIGTAPFDLMTDYLQNGVYPENLSTEDISIFDKRMRTKTYGFSINEYRLIREIGCRNYKDVSPGKHLDLGASLATFALLEQVLLSQDLLEDCKPIHTIIYTTGFMDRLLNYELIFDERKEYSQVEFYDINHILIDWVQKDILYSTKLKYKKLYPWFGEKTISLIASTEDMEGYYNSRKEGSNFINYAPLIINLGTIIEIEIKHIVALEMNQKESDLNFFTALKKLEESDFMQLNNPQMLGKFHHIRRMRNDIHEYDNIPTKEDYEQVKKDVLDSRMLMVMHNSLSILTQEVSLEDKSHFLYSLSENL